MWRKPGHTSIPILFISTTAMRAISRQAAPMFALSIVGAELARHRGLDPLPDDLRNIERNDENSFAGHRDRLRIFVFPGGVEADRCAACKGDRNGGDQNTASRHRFWDSSHATVRFPSR